MYATPLSEATSLIQKFREDHAARASLLQYLNKNYFDETAQQRWMICFRQDIDCAAIDTNNHIESWHNMLKTHFFKDKRQRRPDS
ncbi:hypothetical protein BG005_005299, partial [Podila minutissima]